MSNTFKNSSKSRNKHSKIKTYHERIRIIQYLLAKKKLKTSDLCLTHQTIIDFSISLIRNQIKHRLKHQNKAKTNKYLILQTLYLLTNKNANNSRHIKEESSAKKN